MSWRSWFTENPPSLRPSYPDSHKSWFSRTRKRPPPQRLRSSRIFATDVSERDVPQQTPQGKSANCVAAPFLWRGLPRRQLAPPQVVAENNPLPAHNQNREEPHREPMPKTNAPALVAPSAMPAWNLPHLFPVTRK
jgi:hypothetical protein